MYFLEQGYVDDDATLIMIFLVSFKDLQSYCLMQSAVCGLQSAVCGLQSANVIHRAVTKHDWNKFFTMVSSPSLDSDLVLNLSAPGKNSFIYSINFQSIVCVSYMSILKKNSSSKSPKNLLCDQWKSCIYQN